MSRILPTVADDEAYEAVKADGPRVRRAAAVIAGRHGLAVEDPQPFDQGSLIVLGLGDGHVLKLYSPCYPEDAPIEIAALRAVDGRLGVATPEVVATGELDGWSYLLMSRVSGEPANRAWSERRPDGEPWMTIPRPDQLRIAGELGAAVARLHALPVVDLPPALAGDWEGFLARRRVECVEHHRARGLDDDWLAQIPAFLEAVDLGAPAPVLLHTEIMRDHVFVEGTREGWRLSGLIDFEPAMLGAPEYELAAVGVFFAAGDHEVLGEFLRGYGQEPDPELPRRVLAWTLLHKFSHLVWYLHILGGPDSRDLEDLARVWFGVS